MTKSIIAQSNVCICGQLTGQQEGTVSIYTGGFLIFPSTSIATAVINKSGNFQLKFMITKPQVISLFNKWFYITPGDSVFANVTGSRFMVEKIDFKGRNVNPYIYTMKYDSLKKSFRFKYNEYDFNNGLIKYLDILDVNKKMALNNLNDFSNSHILTNEFKSYAINQITYEYYDQILNPLIYKNYPVEQIPASYSSIINQIKLTQDSLVDKKEYAFTTLDLLEYKKKTSNATEFQLINRNAIGLTKEFLYIQYVSNLILTCDPKDSILTKEIIKKIDNEIKSPEFRNYFIPLKDQLNKSFVPFPKEVMHTALIDSVGHKFTFEDLLLKYKNKFIVLDFWASWCGPCKEGMPEVNKLKKLFNNSAVEFVFISLDKIMKDWRSGLKMTKIPGEHYWVSDNFNSALAKYLKINRIPRYVIINRSGKLEKIDAFQPKPGDYGLQSQLYKLIGR